MYGLGAEKSLLPILLFTLLKSISQLTRTGLGSCECRDKLHLIPQITCAVPNKHLGACGNTSKPDERVGTSPIDEIFLPVLHIKTHMLTYTLIRLYGYGFVRYAA